MLLRLATRHLPVWSQIPRLAALSTGVSVCRATKLTASPAILSSLKLSVLYTPLSTPTLGYAPEVGEVELEVDELDGSGLLCDNLLKKRARKMNKHKHRKNRKKQRFLRRKLGK